MNKIVFSIPTHECVPCIIEHALNIKKMVKNCVGVVVHFSGDSSDETFRELVNSAKILEGFLFINTERFKSHKGDEAGFVTGMSSIFASNFLYISKIIDFDIYGLLTSNELFVREGFSDVIEKYSTFAAYNKSGCRDFPHAKKWGSILEKKFSIKNHQVCPAEGTYYPKEVFKDCSNIILKHLSKEVPAVKGNLVDAQEHIIPTLAFNLFPGIVNNMINANFVECDSGKVAIEKEHILKVHYCGIPNKYVVKRVPRVYTHPIRVFIRDLLKNKN